MLPRWLMNITFACSVLIVPAARADTIKLASQASLEVACYGDAFQGYITAYKDGKFHVYTSIKGCSEKKIPKQCQLFKRIPQQENLLDTVATILKLL